MKFRLQFDIDNAAFGESPDEREAEIAAVLRAVAHSVEERGLPRSGPLAVRDINGNLIGAAQIIP